MKIVQSFWSKPINDGTHSNNESRIDGGWIHIKYFLYCWALSCLKLREFYNDVELYTDAFGKRLLIDHLELPYSKVHTDLDKYNSFHPDLWAAGKLHTYQCQDEPFLHIDGDVIIWKRFTPEFEAFDLVAQNLETDFLTDDGMFYGAIRNDVLKHFVSIPSEIKNNHNDSLKSVNMGVVGGTNFQFFKEYSRKAAYFVESNISRLDRINVSRFNVLYEQFFFHELSRNRGKRIDFLLEDNDLRHGTFVDFHSLSNVNNYLHVLGPFKRNQILCDQIELRLKHGFPIYYDRINRYLQIKSDCVPQYWEQKFQLLSDSALNSEANLNIRFNKQANSPYVDSNAQVISLLRTYGGDDTLPQISRLVEGLSAFSSFVSLNDLLPKSTDGNRKFLISLLLFHWYYFDNLVISNNK